MNKILLGERLLRLRGDKSRKDVAADLGISVSALAMYETGQRIPKDEIKIKLANYYSVSVESIFYISCEVEK